MNRRFYSSILLLSGALAVAAAPLSREQARLNAMSFLREGNMKKLAPGASNAGVAIKDVASPEGLYIFNVGTGGFVIASSSDRTQPVLGYSDEGSFDMSQIPPQAAAWLGELSSAVKSLEQGDAQQKGCSPMKVSSFASKPKIEPLVKSKWNQGDPYNLMTPSYVDANGNTVAHSATGCVATATTQVMYYWKWPQEATKTIPSYRYDWSGNVRTMPALDPVMLNWGDMTDTYSGSSSQASKEAVSQLMLYAGCAMQSGYAGATGATSINAMNALKNYFGYSADMFNVYHLDYTFAEWEDLFYRELSAGRPLLMGADNYERTGGHQFICDGYDGNGLYHINWGWGGYCDGYFVLTVMAPDSQGIGGSTDANGYSMGQNVCVNLRPAYDTPDVETVCASISNFYASQATVNPDESGKFSVNVGCTLRTLLLHRYDIEHAFRLLDAQGNVVADGLGSRTDNYDPASRYSKNMTVEIPALADGIYRLQGISRQSGSSEWLPDLFADHNYLTLTVADNKMKTEAVPGRGEKLRVDEVTLVDATVGGKWQQVKYTITNLGADFYGETYMFVDGKRSSGNTISIPAGESADIYFKFQPKNEPGNHSFVLSRNTGMSNILDSREKMYNIDCMWDASGNITALPPVKTNPSYEVAPSAAAVYLYGPNPRTIVVKEANPNLVLYLDENATISSRVENVYRKNITNIVKGGHAAKVTFSDQYDLAVPASFTADEASYTRSEMPRWSTVIVPFAIDRVSVGDQDLDWFRSADDTGKNIFIKQLQGTRASRVMFKHTETDRIEANTPLFVGVQGELGGTSFDHTGKSVTFSGANTIVEAPAETVANAEKGSAARLLGCYSIRSIAGFHVLDENFETFSKQTAHAGRPLNAYLQSPYAYDSFEIVYGEGEDPSAVEDILDENSEIAADAQVFNLQGIRVGVYADFAKLPAGLYIVAGRKVMKFMK